MARRLPKATRQAIAISLDIQRRNEERRRAAMARSAGNVKHIGFEGLVRKLKREGYSDEQARRIAAHAAQHASAAAKRRNPRLRRVGGA